MAYPGNGARRVNDVLIEMSNHLLVPWIYATLTAPVSSGLQTVAITTILAANLYTGALLVVGTGATAEVVSISNFTTNSITATFTFGHALGDPVSGATFPYQHATDPVFTQTEMLGYVSRAQNEFLERCPCVMALFQQAAVPGVIQQALPPTAIELNRVAASSILIPATSLTRTGGVVTAVFSEAHLQVKGGTFWIWNAPDATFNGVFKAASVVSPTSLTYNQAGANATTAGGNLLQLVRLYETTQTELTMANRSWRQGMGMPTAYFEDRTGVYGWGLGPMPPFGIPLELLCSIRDTDTLGMADGFLVPDPVVTYVKYKALAYAWSKDGVFHDGQRAAYCGDRFERGVMAVQRYFESMLGSMGPIKQ